MIIVSSYKLKNNPLTGIFTVELNDSDTSLCCPSCNGELFYRNSRLRHFKNMIGEVNHINLRRLYCEECRRLHTEIPDIIQPYKHYDSQTIQNVLDGSEDAQMCTADDSTIRSWKTSFKEAKPDIEQRLASVYARETDEKVPIKFSVSSLAAIRAKIEHWLAFVTGLLVNNGHKLRTRFTFCPSSFVGKVNLSSKKTPMGGREDDKTIKDIG